jgi:SAM-dependent methyltransferase
MSAEFLMQGYSDATYGDRMVDIYDDPGQTPSDAEDTVNFLWKLATEHSLECKPSALEFGVGTGRVALPLARKGCEVAGIDPSQAMLDRCRAKDADEALRLVCGDMAAERIEQEAFDVVYAVYNSLYFVTTQARQVASFENAYWHLRPGGYFVVDGFVPNVKNFPLEQQIRIYDMQADFADVDLVMHDPLGQLLVGQNMVVKPVGIEFRPSKRRYIWPSEMDLMARIAGLEFTARYANWSGSPFSGPSGPYVSVYRRVANS